MSLRVVAAIAAVLLAAACTGKGDKAPPSAQAPGSPPTNAPGRTSNVNLPPPSSALPPPASATAPPPSAAPAPQVPSAAGGPASASNVPAARWRAVLIAGDNNSPAFDNGVEALRDKLTARGVQSIKVLSSNPSRAIGAVQLANAGNVRTAIRGMSGDACLAYVTSHGEAKGFFLRPDRKFFEPSMMEAALAGCGNAPTVVIVSACHSGTFMTNEMRKPNRVILTAAARDRTSFGCGSTDLYTYYDQCLLRSFDQAATFRDLASLTRACVENLEKTLSIKAPSDPQNYVGPAVADLRIPGK